MDNSGTHNLSDSEVCRGEWLSMRRAEFLNKHGQLKTWEYAARLHKRGAAMIVATLRPSGRLIIVRQFRPPLNKRAIEFPAGLIDPGESPAHTAVRELREETGFSGSAILTLPPACSSPGLTGEMITSVIMEVDEESHAPDPATAMEDDEDIETLLIHPDDLLRFLIDADKDGDCVDAKLMAYATALRGMSS